MLMLAKMAEGDIVLLAMGVFSMLYLLWQDDNPNETSGRRSMTLIYNDNVVLKNVVAFSCYQQETGENQLTVRFANGEMFATTVKNAWRVIKKEDENGNIVSSIRCSLLSRHRPRRSFNLEDYEGSQVGYRIPKLLAVRN